MQKKALREAFAQIAAAKAAHRQLPKNAAQALGGDVWWKDPAKVEANKMEDPMMAGVKQRHEYYAWEKDQAAAAKQKKAAAALAKKQESWTAAAARKAALDAIPPATLAIMREAHASHHPQVERRLEDAFLAKEARTRQIFQQQQQAKAAERATQAASKPKTEKAVTDDAKAMRFLQTTTQQKATVSPQAFAYEMPSLPKPHKAETPSEYYPSSLQAPHGQPAANPSADMGFLPRLAAATVPMLIL